MAPSPKENDSWLERFEGNDQAAAQEIADAYHERLVRLARKRLAQLPPQVGDDEGAVISALRSFFSGVQADQFPKLLDGDDL